MSNYTIEDYKNAIKAKYKEEADGEYSNYLSSPTPANLRKLCVKRFTSNNNSEDLSGFESFFDFPFEKDKKNLFGEDELNKLEAVKRFFLGITEKPADDTIQLAAILVDLQPRPFREFRKQIDPENLKLINDLRTPIISEKKSIENQIIDKEIQNSSDVKNEQEPDPIQSEESEPVQSEESETTEPEVTNSNPINDKSKSKVLRYLAISLVLFGLALIIFLALNKKDCMQWTGDHFEEVSCNVKIEGIGTFNVPEPYDERVINLRKIKVCDTTSFFRNEKAIIWYAKVGDSIEFFNTHGSHPENGRGLKPVTQYIINKYVVKH